MIIGSEKYFIGWLVLNGMIVTYWKTLGPNTVAKLVAVMRL